jgi:hypothetical protein
MKSILAVAVLAALAAGCSKSATVEGPAGEKLKLSVPASVTVTQGEMAKVDVKLTRNNLPGPVSIRFSGLPAGVDVVDPDQTLPGDTGTFTLRAAPGAAIVEKNQATATATAADGIGVTQTFNVNVKEKR